MFITDYLKGKQKKAFSEKANITRVTLDGILAGKAPTLDTVIKIEYATNGKVKAKDMLEYYKQKNGAKYG